MDKNKRKIIFFVVIISIIITIAIAMKLLDTSGSVNQGNFRINDVVINSYAKLDENTENINAQVSSDLVFNLSQNNKITMLIDRNVQAERIYIDNIKYTEPLKKGNLVVYQTDSENSYELNSDLNTIELNPVEKDNEYYIEINIENLEFLKDVKAPENIKKVTFDGTFFKDLNIRIEELQMSFECDLNIVDITGKKSYCKLKFNFPPEELLNNGISILRQDLSKYIFKLK